MGLSMDPASASYAPEFLTQNSDLVDASFPGGAPVAQNGSSRAGRPVAHGHGRGSRAANAFDTVWGAILPSNAADGVGGSRISVDGSPGSAWTWAPSSRPTRPPSRLPSRTPSRELGVTSGITVDVALSAGPAPDAAVHSMPRSCSRGFHGRRQCVDSPGLAHDVTAALMLGSALGGKHSKTGAFAHVRPAPSGNYLRAVSASERVRECEILHDQGHLAGLLTAAPWI